MTRKLLGLMIAGSFVLILTGSLTGIGLYKAFIEEPPSQYVTFEEPALTPTFSKYTDDVGIIPHPGFVEAAEKALPAVVHIKSRYALKRGNQDADFFSNPFREFFDENNSSGPPQGMASGSGVLISKEGHVATNFHVIEDADELEVTLYDNRTYVAEVIGADPNTDLALLKIKGGSFDHLTFGNSDEVRIGEWVLAVGNPMDLTSTVTAGIVSAKGRNINLLEGERGTDRGLTIESFIQTDAAVNRGNSGGALVNTNGQLIGINTAIASRTGSYAGYSFAIPSTMVRKVMEDLLRYGEVRRGFLGISIRPVDAELAEDRDLNTLKGAYVSSVNKSSGAYEAGIKAGDVIISVNDMPINNTSELQEQVSRYRPGDYIDILIMRNSQRKKVKVQLKTQLGETRIAERKNEVDLKGSTFRLLTTEEMADLGINYGVKVVDAGPKLARGGVREDFVITELNGERIRTIEQLEIAVEESGDFVTVRGMFSKGMIASYSFSW